MNIAHCRATGRVAAAALLALAVAAGAGLAAEWPHLHGPGLDGISRESGLSPDAPKPIWRQDIGTGFSSIAIAGGLAFTLGNKREFDTIYCFDAKTGDQKWRQTYQCQLQPNMYEGGPNATPTVHGGKVYTLSKEGHIFCIEAASGKIVWKRHASDFGAAPPSWGFAGSPTIVGDLVVLNVGDKGLALNKDTGEPAWQSGGEGAGYATPLPYTLEGKPTAVAIFRGSGVASLDAKTGAEQWHIEWPTQSGINCATPVYFDGKLFVSSSYGVGCALYDVTASPPRELWRNREMHNHFATSAYYKGHIYGLDGHSGGRSKLKCVDPATGKSLWAHEVGFGTMRLADGKLFVLNEDGELIVVEAVPDRYSKLAINRILSSKCWTVPTISDGRLYARNAAGELVCFELAAK
jgi:outer membrane protein assembly factor BamB